MSTNTPKLDELSFQLEDGIYLSNNKPCKKYKPNVYFQIEQAYTWVRWLDNQDVTIVKADTLTRLPKEVEVLYETELKALNSPINDDAE